MPAVKLYLGILGVYKKKLLFVKQKCLSSLKNFSIIFIWM